MQESKVSEGIAQLWILILTHAVLVSCTVLLCKQWLSFVQASGAALALVDAVVEASWNRHATDEVPAGYSIARPPGHHATANQAMGFCLLNNVAIAARYAQQHHGLKKVPAIFCWWNALMSLLYYIELQSLWCASLSQDWLLLHVYVWQQSFCAFFLRCVAQLAWVSLWFGKTF